MILYFNEEKPFSTIYSKGTQNLEVNAIDGAKETIKKYKPVLAICIYHKAEDWYNVPQAVLEIEKDYDIYLRHYMEGIFETVMYFIPKS